MRKNVAVGLSSLVLLQSFTVFPEYFIIISSIYVLFVAVLIVYNIYVLMFQKALSECMALILLMSCFLIYNDDLISFNFLTFNNSIINDYFSFFTKILICFFSAIYFLFIANFLKEQKLISFEYVLVLLFAILGLILMCSSNDLLISYLAIELSSLAFYILASFKKTSSYSVESGLKYCITGAVSSSFFLLGSSFIYCCTGSINFSDFFDLFEYNILIHHPFNFIFEFSSRDILIEMYKLLYDISEDIFINVYNILSEIQVIHAIKGAMFTVSIFEVFGIEPQFLALKDYFSYNFLELGLTLILFSLFIKLALAPFHLWSLDVYEGSPTSSTFFFAVISKLSIFVLLVRICYISFFSLKDCWQFYSLLIGVFSIFVGSFGGLKQRKLKTLLAYSSTSHMGYVLLAFSTSTYLGIQMLLFYMIIYMISSLCVWFILLALRLKTKLFINKYNKELSDLMLLNKSNAMLALALSLTMFSIAGIPPLLGFLAKMSVFLSLVGISFYFVALVTIIFSVVSTFYYIRVTKVLYFENCLVGKLYYPINTSKTIFLSSLIFSILFLFIKPSVLYMLNYKIILSLL
jgi:NADH:ubiquinone oxidoreductase subunit 2 (subunit N)